MLMAFSACLLLVLLQIFSALLLSLAQDQSGNITSTLILIQKFIPKASSFVFPQDSSVWIAVRLEKQAFVRKQQTLLTFLMPISSAPVLVEASNKHTGLSFSNKPGIYIYNFPKINEC